MTMKQSEDLEGELEDATEDCPERVTNVMARIQWAQLRLLEDVAEKLTKVEKALREQKAENTKNKTGREASAAHKKKASKKAANAKSGKPKATRRKYTGEYKASIVARAEACKDTWDLIGDMLRSEGLHYSQLSDWRKQAASGALAALEAKRRGPAVDKISKIKKDNAKALQKLRRKLERDQKKKREKS